MPGESSSIFLVKNSSGAVLLLLACLEPFVGSELMSMQLSVFQLRIQSKVYYFFSCFVFACCRMWSMAASQWEG